MLVSILVGMGGLLAHAASFGDLDGDGEASILDYVLLANHLNQIAALPGEQLAFADANQDGRIDDGDLDYVVGAILLRHGLIEIVPTRVLLTSPRHGESGVAVTRETVVYFDTPLVLDAGGWDEALVATFGGQELGVRRHVSQDRRAVTLFYDEPLPASARVRVSVNGDRLVDERGLAVDADGDGVPGGLTKIDFDTLTLTVLEQTAVCGRVFASELGQQGGGAGLNVPLAGVRITVDGREDDLNAVTDAQGNFRLEPAPAGRFFVHINGTFAVQDLPAGAYYPSVGKAWESVPGQEVSIGEVFLPLIREGTLQELTEGEATVIEFPEGVVAALPELAGVRLDVPAGALIDADGGSGGAVGISPVAPDRLPGRLPEGLNFPVVITVQTDGAQNFDAPVPVCFPNLPDPESGERLLPGAHTALWSFNHDTGRFEIVGPMTVSPDGETVCSDAGFGIIAPGWHGVSPGTETEGCDPDLINLQNLWEVAKAIATCVESVRRKVNVFLETLKRSVGLGSDLLDSVLKLKEDPVGGAFAILNTLKKGFFDIAEIFATLKSSVFESVKAALVCLEALVSAFAEICDRVASGSPGCDTWENEALCLSLTAVSEGLQHLNAFLALFDAQRVGSAIRQICALIDAVLVAREDFIETGTGLEEIENALNQLESRLSSFLSDYVRVSESDEDFGDLIRAIGGVSDNADALLRRYEPPEEGYYLLWYDGVEVRGRLFGTNQIREILPAEVEVAIRVYDGKSNRFASQTILTAPSGVPTKIPLLAFESADMLLDSDGDGLVDVAEEVVGTLVDAADSDQDGILDGAELEQGLDPLEGHVTLTGIVATADTPGQATDVYAFNDLVVVADGNRGVSVFNVFNGMDPLIVAQVDTPGTADVVHFSGSLVAVGDRSEGLAIIDIADPPAAVIRHQISRTILGGRVIGLVTGGGVGYVGLSNGDLVSIDLASGTLLSRLPMGSQIQDVALFGDYGIVLSRGKLSVVHLTGESLELAGEVFSQGDIGAGGRLMRLFAGVDVVYSVHSSGYNTFDISDPGNPRLIAAGSTQQFGWKQLVTNGSGIGIATVGPNSTDDGQHHVSVYDVLDPAETNEFLTTFETPGLAQSVSLFNGIGYVADSARGLQVLNYLPYDRDGVAPSIRLETNFESSRAEEGQLMRVTARVEDDVQVRNVEFFVDGEWYATDGNFPFEIRLVTPFLTDQTSFTISARASDTGGNATLSPIQVIHLLPDARPPRVTRVRPDTGATLGRVGVAAAFFNEPMDPVSLLAGAWNVLEAGADGVFDTLDDRTIPGEIEWRPEVLGSFFAFEGGAPPGKYRLEVTDVATDASGNPLEQRVTWSFRVFDIQDDRDGDGVPDLLEPELGLNADAPDSDQNGVFDGDEDFDRDGLSNLEEVLLGFDATFSDTDGDGVLDGAQDTDRDGLRDIDEWIRYNTDPQNHDTDGDGFNDGDELADRSSPVNALSLPESLYSGAVAPLVSIRNLSIPGGSRGEAFSEVLSVQNRANPSQSTGEVITPLISVLNEPKPE